MPPGASTPSLAESQTQAGLCHKGGGHGNHGFDRLTGVAVGLLTREALTETGFMTASLMASRDRGGVRQTKRGSVQLQTTVAHPKFVQALARAQLQAKAATAELFRHCRLVVTVLHE